MSPLANTSVHATANSGAWRNLLKKKTDLAFDVQQAMLGSVFAASLPLCPLSGLAHNVASGTLLPESMHLT